MLIKKIKSLFTDTFQQAEATVIEKRSASFDKKTPIVLIVAAFSLLLVEYFGRSPGHLLMIDIFQAFKLNGCADTLRNFMENSGNIQIHQLFYWVCTIGLFYVLFPLIIIKTLLREEINDFGLKRGLVLKHYKIYILMLIFMLPLVFFFSDTKSFQDRYPFYRLSIGESLYPFFWLWQILYFIQFICVEFFFRGFLLHGLKHKFGYYSVFITTIPYCMVHFGKPMPETISAIFAGIILGTLSLKSNSIWLGVFIHYSVAITMDLAALWRMGYFD
jgi:membrane protease YdiL (CAAX protease family)